MVTKRIDHSSNTPPVFLHHVPDDFGAGCHRAVESRVWIIDNHYHPAGTSTKRLRAKVAVLRRFVAKPELGSTDSQPSNLFPALAVYAKQLFGSKGSFVELNRRRTVPNREPRRNSCSLD